MRRKKTYSLLVLTIVWLANAGVAIALEVALSECPDECNTFPPDPTDPCLRSCEECHRTDGAITTVDSGSPDEWFNSTQSCDNCVTECPNCPPNIKDCTLTMSEEWCETVTATVGSSIVTGAAGLKTGLEASIGHASQRCVTISKSCTIHVSGCKKQTHGIKDNVTSGISKSQEHTYEYYGDEPCGCGSDCYFDGGEDTSTVSGDSWIDSSGTCYNVTTQLDCD